MPFYLKRVVLECTTQGILSDLEDTYPERSDDGLEPEIPDENAACASRTERLRKLWEAWKHGLFSAGISPEQRDVEQGNAKQKDGEQKEAPDGEEQAEIVTKGAEEKALQGTLWISDDPNAIQSHLAKGDPLLVLLHADAQGESFLGVKYMAMHLTELDTDYLDKVYRRHAGIPWEILETERCFLRETTEEDVDAFYRIYAEPSVTAYMEDLFADREQELAYTRDYIKNVYEFYGHGVWTVCLKETGEVIGRAGLSFREGYEEPELGFLIGVPWQGRGLATEVCRAILQFGAKKLGFTKVIAFTEPENEVSVHLLKKLGFEANGEAMLLGKRHVIYHFQDGK